MIKLGAAHCHLLPSMEQAVDGQEGADCNEILTRPMFSPDSRHVVYKSKTGHRICIVIDGKAGPEVDSIVYGGPIFHADGTIEYLYTKDKTLYRARYFLQSKVNN